MSTILFEKPQNVPILKSMTVLDMHSHSRFSDGRNPIQVCLHEAQRKGIQLCVTDHNLIRGSVFAAQQGLTLPSIEITSLEAKDLLLYFASVKELEQFYLKYVHEKQIKQHGFTMTWYQLQYPLMDLLEHASEFNALKVLAHPTTVPPKESASYFADHKPLLKHIDALEGMNSMMTTQRNRDAEKYAHLWKKPMVGGSDAHIASSIGHVVTAVHAEKPADILEALRRGDNLVVGKPLPFFHKMNAMCTLVGRNLKWHGI